MRLRQSLFVLATLASGIFACWSRGAPRPRRCSSSSLSIASNATKSRDCENFGNIGPSLIGLKDRYPDRKEVSAIIFDETKRNPQTVMMPFGRNLILTNKEIETIVDYLYAQ